MGDDMIRPMAGGAGVPEPSPFEQIKRVNAAGNVYWSSRDFARVLGYADYRNFEQVIEKARLSCFNSGQRPEDHFVEITELIEIGKGGQVTPMGSEQSAIVSQKTRVRRKRAAPSEALVRRGQRKSMDADEAARVLAAWESLPPVIRSAMMTIANAGTGAAGL